MMWGSGTTNGRGPRYTEAALSTENAVPTLIEVHHLIASGEIAAAYNLHKRLTGIGPAFHTKWMWLMGRVTRTLPTPLILDARVGRASPSGVAQPRRGRRRSTSRATVRILPRGLPGLVSRPRSGSHTGRRRVHAVSPRRLMADGA